MLVPFVPPKLILSMRGMKNPDALHQSQLVHTNITNHNLFQHTWPTSAVQLDEFGGSITNMRDAMVAAATKDQLKLAHCITCRNKLDHDYYYIGRYAEIVAGSDYSVLEALGYPMAQSSTHKGPPPMLAPSKPILRHRDTTIIIAQVAPLAGARSIEAQYTTGDPTVESNFGMSCVFGNRRDMQFHNMTPGLVYAFRFRGIFAKGPGPWSVIVTLRAI
jgi:hypothetical protein